jgi:hypothetical protein
MFLMILFFLLAILLETNGMPKRLQVRKRLIANDIVFFPPFGSVRFRTICCPVVNNSFILIFKKS